MPAVAAPRSLAIAHSCAADEAGVTPLIEAVKNGHVEVVRILLEKGLCKINATTTPHSLTRDTLPLFRC